MTLLKQLSTGRQVLLTFGTLCAILGAIGAWSFFGLLSIERYSQDQLSYAVNETELVAGAAQNVGLMQTVIFRHVLASDPAEIKIHDQMIHEIDTTNAAEIAAYQKFVNSEEEAQLYAQVLQTRKKYIELTDQLLELSRANLDAQAAKFAASNQIPAYEGYQKAIKAMNGYADGDVRAIKTAMGDYIARIRAVGNIIVIMAILIAMGTGLAITTIARRLKEDNCVLQIEVAERKRAQAEVEDIHKQLMTASRQSGMAEIASNVLHNVGNVLNSVNVSATVVADRVRKSRGANLRKVVTMLREHEADLGAFFTQDPKGTQIPAFLATLTDHLDSERADLVTEIRHLQTNVEHIKEIVARQQSYATFGGVKEMVNMVHLVEDGLLMTEEAFSRHGVEVIRNFEIVPFANVEKHKILQILVNLLRNAKHACQESDRADKRVTVHVVNGRGSIKICVIDNGVGIPAENLTRIFNYGFTTRKDGHGFGLHSGANAAKEMGGSLTVQSGGPTQGAAFTLELPCPSQEV